MKVLCIGHSSYDITLLLDEFPKENKKIRLLKRRIECGGGCASNASVLLSKWGLSSYIASAVGEDFYGDKIKKEYKYANVNTKYLETTKYNTTVSYILVNTETGTRTILTDKDKNLELNLEIEDKFDYILVDGDNFETSRKTILNNPNSTTILDAGKVTDNILALSKLVNYIICSNDFAKNYTNISFSYDNIEQIKEVYDIIQGNFPGTLIITLESMGSFVKLNGEYHLVSSINVKALDTTGAGDIYHAAFLYFISQGYDVLHAMKYSNIAAGLGVSKVGGRNSIPELDEVINYGK